MFAVSSSSVHALFQIKSNQIKSNQIKSNQIKSNQIKSNQIKSNQTKYQTKPNHATSKLRYNVYGLASTAHV
ncbi:unnamed protein product [Ambrosiozyma monospora]|uniref:Unnamed protein product n=1 Tax=Ambrosiozyma monospora TaxID=43982 RepID=A0A9W6YZG0_AMBMO|nr:unnamed protein product [Ambrosiozyma monospora]